MEKKKYIQCVVLVVLFTVLGRYVIEKILWKNESITALEFALKMAKENRIELEKVLCFYKRDIADSLKYKAACFLIENMPYYSYACGKQLEDYKKYYAWLKDSHGKTPEEVADSVRKSFGMIGRLGRKYDLQEVDSAYLCNNIEWAFKVWREQPWGKNISFNIFCEYLLPYRIGDESLIYWRKMYYEKYNPLLDSLRMSNVLDKEDPIIAANYLIDRLMDKSQYHTSVVPYSFGNIGPEYVQYMSGTCRERTDFGVYLLRALGIPCSVDFFAVCSRANVGHFWLASWDKNGEDFRTEFPQNFILTRKERWFMWEDAPKIYRRTFSLNKELLSDMTDLTIELYPFWRVPSFIDISYRYAFYYKELLKIPSSKIYKRKIKSKIAYLCVSSRNNWIPVDWTEYDVGNLCFKDIRKGAIMRVAVYEDNMLLFVTDPFRMDKKTNELFFYSCSEEKQNLILYAKYTLDEESIFIDRMIGGVFEGSNHANFSNSDTLYIIQRKPFRLNTSIKSWSSKKYRYIRYVGPDLAHCNIAEIVLYGNNDTIPLKGNLIGSFGCYQRDGSHEYTNAFDGKTWTSFDALEKTGGWVGIDFGDPKCINRIVYTPRNRDNYIRPGDIYELFYCDNTWKTAGIQEAFGDSLVYNCIPKNALLLLCNQTRGTQERIFTYENNKQEWK